MGRKTSDLPYANQEWFKRQENHANHVPRTECTEKQLEFIDWLLDPSREKGSQDQWAEQHGVSPRTLRLWKKQKYFTDAWEKKAAEAYGGMERLQAVLDKLYSVATDAEGDKAVKAIQLYLQYVDRYTPKTKVITEGTSLEDLSDEELAQLGENITRLRKEA